MTIHFITQIKQLHISYSETRGIKIRH